MGRVKKQKSGSNSSSDKLADYRHKKVKRLNIPPAGLAARGEIVKEKKVRYAYNPHLSPLLRFDATGKADGIKQLLDKAGRQKLEPAELVTLEAALRNHGPWLEWAGKREQQWCVADPVALNIHERVSTQAILRVARREDVQRDLFADPDQEYREAVQFYKHKMDWTNRMILGDSLAVMASLARREGLAGKVQMIYMDPPYGIKYSSNFQPEVGRRVVGEGDEDLTREPETIKAYRDTWTLGVHSYLSYLRDRLLLCRELLAESGSIFVQISHENQHRLRSILEEVFGAGNFLGVICYVTTSTQGTDFLPHVNDFILWFAKSKGRCRYRQLYEEKIAGERGSSGYVFAELPSGEIRRTTESLEGGHVFSASDLTSSHKSVSEDVEVEGQKFTSGHRYWSTSTSGMVRLRNARRLMVVGNNIRFKRHIDDFMVYPRTNFWTDTGVAGFTADRKVYVVQTNDKVIERCMLMTTDPGDLVLDPTCGGGTSAYVAEEWGRRWITIDVSRVALAIARQRVLTAKFDYCKLRPTSAEDAARNPDGPWLTDPDGQIQGASTFDCKTVPHVTLKSIAHNQALDPIFDKWEPVVAEKLSALNGALSQGAADLRTQLLAKLEDKRKREGKKAITDADRRRWLLPPANREGKPYTTVDNNFAGWYDWEVPFDAEPDWPKPLQDALAEYRKAWRSKMDEVNACIAARADQEELVDQPLIDKSRVRVSGPFTVEGVIPAEESIDDEGQAETPIAGAPEELEAFGEGPIETEPQNAEAYLDRMVRLLREDGVRFPGNRVMKFTTLETLADGSTLHAKGTWGEGSDEKRVAVMFGPQYGPLVAAMVEDGIRMAARRGYDDLVFAAFSFDGAAQAVIQEDPDPKVRIHMAQIRPDVAMGDLLKTTVSSQLFTVSGSPRVKIDKHEDGQFVVNVEGVDIYDPVTNSVRSTGAEKVAAWFLDSDYDGRCFCICQAFFPDRSAWDRLARALGGALDEAVFEKLAGTVSLPFPAGPHKRVAIKVIDPRGNEVLSVRRLADKYDR
jgi:adenine-specific DNA-methyltransferase